MTSIAGSRVHSLRVQLYATSKAALAAPTVRCIRLWSIRCTSECLAPGEIRTDIISPETEQLLAPEIPPRRLGTTAEVADTIFYLCSDTAQYAWGGNSY